MRPQEPAGNQLPVTFADIGKDSASADCSPAKQGPTRCFSGAASFRGTGSFPILTLWEFTWPSGCNFPLVCWVDGTISTAADSMAAQLGAGSDPCGFGHRHELLAHRIGGVRIHVVAGITGVASSMIRRLTAGSPPVGRGCSRGNHALFRRRLLTRICHQHSDLRQCYQWVCVGWRGRREWVDESGLEPIAGLGAGGG